MKTFFVIFLALIALSLALIALSLGPAGALGNVTDQESSGITLAVTSLEGNYLGTGSKGSVNQFGFADFAIVSPDTEKVPFSSDSQEKWNSAVLQLSERFLTHAPGIHLLDKNNLEYLKSAYNFYSLTPSWSE